MSITVSTAAGSAADPAVDAGPALDSATAPDVGLRERKRRATSRSIQHAVLQLSRDKGLDNVTVDEISRRADISPRTFFNYFSSKESAVLGESPFTLQPDAVRAFIDAGPDEPVFDGLLTIMRSMAETDDHDLEMHQLRKLVVRDYPHLLVQRITSMHEFETQLAVAVEERLALDARQGASETESPDQQNFHDRARLIAMVAIATMRHAWARWAAASETQSMSTLLAQSFRELQTLL